MNVCTLRLVQLSGHTTGLGTTGPGPDPGTSLGSPPPPGGGGGRRHVSLGPVHHPRQLLSEKHPNEDEATVTCTRGGGGTRRQMCYPPASKHLRNGP